MTDKLRQMLYFQKIQWQCPLSWCLNLQPLKLQIKFLIGRLLAD
uniref:Uncharacterized protein n=1 Tax=Anguilla anguilla TaxID=7936 RepID=A0A0E9QSI3_ANGAN